MRSRLAITMMVVLGILFTTTGAGLAVSGISSSGSAASAQYPPTTPTGPTNPPPPPGGTTETNNPPTISVSPTVTSGGPAPQPQAVRQVKAVGESKQLPFTGYAAIPILLAGIGLLGAGLLVRRRATDQ